jgi:hypothetical protein
MAHRTAQMAQQEPMAIGGTYGLKGRWFRAMVQGISLEFMPTIWYVYVAPF